MIVVVVVVVQELDRSLNPIFNGALVGHFGQIGGSGCRGFECKFKGNVARTRSNVNHVVIVVVVVGIIGSMVHVIIGMALCFGGRQKGGGMMTKRKDTAAGGSDLFLVRFEIAKGLVVIHRHGRRLFNAQHGMLNGIVSLVLIVRLSVFYKLRRGLLKFHLCLAHQFQHNGTGLIGAGGIFENETALNGIARMKDVGVVGSSSSGRSCFVMRMFLCMIILIRG